MSKQEKKEFEIEELKTKPKKKKTVLLETRKKVVSLKEALILFKLNKIKTFKELGNEKAEIILR